MKVKHDIEGDPNRVKISPCKSKQPNLEALKYIKGLNYPGTEFGKYIYAIREGQSREGKKYDRIQLSVAHEVTWVECYTTLRGR